MDIVEIVMSITLGDGSGSKRREVGGPSHLGVEMSGGIDSSCTTMPYQ
jgi:hypothetical protein